MEPQTDINSGIPEPGVIASTHHGMGAVVGTLIVLAVLVLGGAYFLNRSTHEPRYEPPVILGDDNANTGLPPTSSSDSVNDISADIDATNLGELESQISTDLQTAEANL